MDKIENGFFILNFAIGAKLFCLLYAIYVHPIKDIYSIYVLDPIYQILF